MMDRLIERLPLHAGCNDPDCKEPAQFVSVEEFRDRVLGCTYRVCGFWCEAHAEEGDSEIACVAITIEDPSQ